MSKCQWLTSWLSRNSSLLTQASIPGPKHIYTVNIFIHMERALPGVGTWVVTATRKDKESLETHQEAKKSRRPLWNEGASWNFGCSLDDLWMFLWSSNLLYRLPPLASHLLLSLLWLDDSQLFTPVLSFPLSSRLNFLVDTYILMSSRHSQLKMSLWEVLSTYVYAYLFHWVHRIMLASITNRSKIHNGSNIIEVYFSLL